MKILEINKFNFPKGGADIHFLDIVNLLKKNGHQVATFSMHHSQNLESSWSKYFVSYVGYSSKDKPWEKIKGVFRMFFSLESKRKIRKIIKDFKPDIVHIHNIYHQISPSILSEIKKKGIPIVMTVHDYKLVCPNYLFLCQGKEWDEIKKNRFWFFVKNRCFKNSFLKSLLVYFEWQIHKTLKIYEKNIDLFISPSVFLKNKLVKEGINKNKIIILPHFSEKTEKSAKIKAGKDFVFHYGRLSKEKGTQDIIDIFKEIPEIELHLAGRMENDLDFKKYSNIKYVGFLGKKEIQRHIQESLFVVSASTLPETFGLVALETISNGKPFVALKKGAYCEIISEEEGFLVANLTELENVIKKLISNKSLREKMSIKALQKAQKFNQNTYHQKLLKNLTSLIKNDRIPS